MHDISFTKINQIVNKTIEKRDKAIEDTGVAYLKKDLVKAGEEARKIDLLDTHNQHTYYSLVRSYFTYLFFRWVSENNIDVKYAEVANDDFYFHACGITYDQYIEFTRYIYSNTDWEKDGIIEKNKEKFGDSKVLFSEESDIREKVIFANAFITKIFYISANDSQYSNRSYTETLFFNTKKFQISTNKE